jgi:hypothetical protein
MQQIVSSFNLLLATVVGGSIALGMLLGEIRIRAMAFGLTVGFVVAQVLPDSLLKTVPGTDRKVAIIWAMAVVFVVSSLFGQRHAQRSFRTIFFAIATALFGVSISLVLLPVGTRQELVTNYYLAAMVYDLRAYIILAEVGFIVFSTLIPLKSKEERKHRRKKK